MKTTSLTQNRLHELLIYDQTTGVFTRAKAVNGRTKKGEIAGRKNADGYVVISVDNVTHVAHRLAFLWVTGEHPSHELQVDHINGKRDDNRWENLRLVTANENQHNRHHADIFHGRTSKRLGVCFKDRGRNRWEANIRVGGKLIYLGRYANEDEAANAYMKAKAYYHPTAKIVCDVT
jgi:hypothetical protein